MNLARSVALARHEARILRRDPTPFIITAVFPLAMMAFLKPAFAGTLRANGVVGATGAEQAVPGMAVMFSMFLMCNVAFGFLRELDWRTWTRLSLTPAGAVDLVLGKLLCAYVFTAGLLGMLVVVGGWLFGLEVQGSWAALALIVLLTGGWLTAAGVLIAAVSRTVPQATALANLITLVLGGIGGVLTPVSTLPGWATTVAPATPTYWTMQGLVAVTAGDGLDDVGRHAMALGLFGIVATAAATVWLASPHGLRRTALRRA